CGCCHEAFSESSLSLPSTAYRPRRPFPQLSSLTSACSFESRHKREAKSHQMLPLLHSEVHMSATASGPIVKAYTETRIIGHQDISCRISKSIICFKFSSVHTTQFGHYLEKKKSHNARLQKEIFCCLKEFATTSLY
ncbi:unnamed protein product, partial [Musa textilis]